MSQSLPYHCWEWLQVVEANLAVTMEAMLVQQKLLKIQKAVVRLTNFLMLMKKPLTLA